jgi:hypothetical protein
MTLIKYISYGEMPMSKAISIRGHYDGKVIVLDEPVTLPKNLPLVIDIYQSPSSEPAHATREERLEALKHLIDICANDPSISLSKLKRDTDREEEGCGY